MIYYYYATDVVDVTGVFSEMDPRQQLAAMSMDETIYVGY